MDFAPHTPSRRRSESIVAMINVVFLLLIFFLMNAQLTPPDAVDVDLPVAFAPEADKTEVTVVIAANGDISVDGELLQTQDLVSIREKSITIKADAAAPARALARALKALSGKEISVVVEGTR